MATVEILLKDNVTLKVECIDRLDLNGYVPRLQRPQNLWWFLHEHRGCPVISPMLVKRLTDDFVRKIDRFAKANAVPVVHFDKKSCKEEIAQKKLEAFEGEEGVVMIGVAQEKISSFRSYQKNKGQPRPPGQTPLFRLLQGPGPREPILLLYPRSRLRALLHQVLLVRSLHCARLGQRT